MTEEIVAPENTCPTGWALPHPLTLHTDTVGLPAPRGEGWSWGLLNRNSPCGLQESDRVGFMWGHLPSAGPAPTRWSFGGGEKWKAVGEGHLGDQRPALPANSHAGLQIERFGMQGCAGSVSDGPNRQDHEDPSPPKQEAGLCPGLLPPAPRRPGCFSADPQMEQGCLWPKGGLGAGVLSKHHPPGKAAAWA